MNLIIKSFSTENDNIPRSRERNPRLDRKVDGFGGVMGDCCMSQGSAHDALDAASCGDGIVREADLVCVADDAGGGVDGYGWDG